MPQRDERLLAFARQMRRESTPAEAKLWSLVRAGRVDGVKFSHQVLIHGFIADFAARSRKLVVEIDGDSHDLTAEQDTRRTAILNANGYRAIRFTNEDVMNHTDGVLVVLREALAQPSPLRGEGRPRSGQGEGQ